MSVIIKQRHIPSDVSLPDLHPVLASVLAARGVTRVDMLDRDLRRLLSYQNLKGIDEAVACLYEALQQQQTVVVVGDFDADGATSSALAVLAMRSFGLKNIDYVVPNRFEYGYGLTSEIVSVAIERYQPQLIITVDNGITSVEGVALAKQLGVRVIITDHHLPPETLPDALAIVNPNQHGDDFASKMLAGVGVIFYVMLALRSYLRQNHWFEAQGIAIPNMAHFLDLVALGTVADVVPLDYNNRILVHHGLNRLRMGNCRTGIRALMQVARCQKSTLTASDLGFKIAPRLNAAGRLKDMSLGITCLLETDFKRACEIAQQLNQLNQERREIEQDMKEQAMAALKTLHLKAESLPSGLCLFDSNWHQGVIGILAARVKDKIHRPVAIFTQEDEQHLKASVRSITGVHIRDVLANIAASRPGLLVKFGGHAMAAGLTLSKLRYDEFKALFDQHVSQHMTTEMMDRIVLSDGTLTAQDLTLKMAEQLNQAGPWGQGFPEPLFEGEFELRDQQLMKERHLKLLLHIPGRPRCLKAIAFNVNRKQWPNHRCRRVYLAYRLGVNAYLNLRSLQIVVEELHAIE